MANQLTLEQVRSIITETHHHPMGLSGVNGWSNCPGSVLAQVGIPDPGSDFAAEGTKAHELGEFLLNDEYVNPEEYGDEMLEHITGYVKYVLEQSKGGRYFVEQKLDLNHIIPECFGTADAIVLVGDALKVIDLKYGMGFVPAETDQLKGYLSGAIEQLSKKGIHPTRFEAHIYQPRNGGARMVEYTLDEIKAFEDYISIQALKCFEPDPALSPGEAQCKYCRAKKDCPALFEHTLTVVGDDFDVLPEPSNLTNEKISHILDNKSLIEMFLKTVESEAMSRSQHGIKIPGYKMVEGRSVRKWIKDAESIIEPLLGDDAYDKKLKSFTKVEKILGKKHFESLNVIEKPEGKPTMVRDDDPREAIKSIEDHFDEIN